MAMSKDKNKKIQEQIKFLEDQMTNALTKKVHNAGEFNIQKTMDKIKELKKKLV